MLSINEIKKPIAADIDVFEGKFKASMQSSVPLLDRITHYIVKRKGKQIRPMFVFFSASICGGINESTHRGAALVELLHTATLIHDDVVDNSYQRRGFFSINALWKNKIAVLVGDYLMSKSLLLSIQHDDFRFLKIVSEAMKQMIEGELLQVEKVRKMDIEEPIYYEVIRKKTASLIASCCECGAASAGADDATIEKMKIKIFGGLLAAALAFTSVAEAQTNAPVINHRHHRQERRINQGVRSGELTRREAHHLRDDERRIARNERIAKADGHVSRAERRHLRREENRTSRAIYRDKHNDRVR